MPDDTCMYVGPSPLDLGLAGVRAAQQVGWGADGDVVRTASTII